MRRLSSGMDNVKPSISWLLIRGLGRESRHWGDFPEKLRTQFPNSTLHLLDLPGTGKSADQRPAWSIPKLTGQTRKHYRDIIMSARESKRQVGLIGISLGGMVSLEWATQFPNDLDGVVIINSSVGKFNGPLQRLRPKALKHLLRSLLVRKIESYW